MKVKLNLKSSLDDVLNPDVTILKNIHNGFRLSVEGEMVSNVKSAIIEQMKKTE